MPRRTSARAQAGQGEALAAPPGSPQALLRDIAEGPSKLGIAAGQQFRRVARMAPMQKTSGNWSAKPQQTEG